MTPPARRTSRLASEIGKRRPFDAREEELFLNLARSYHDFAAPVQRLLKDHGLSMSLFNALRIAVGHDPEPVTVGTITEQLIFPAPDTTRLVERLEALGLATREQGTEDRRTVFVRPTAKGRRAVATLRPCVEALLREHLDHLTAAQADTLIQLLEQIRSPRRA